LYCGLQRSDFVHRSFGIEAVRNHWRISPHISARLFCHIAGFDDFQPKLTPRTLYRCSFKRSRCRSRGRLRQGQRALGGTLRLRRLLARQSHGIFAFISLNRDNIASLARDNDRGIIATSSRINAQYNRSRFILVLRPLRRRFVHHSLGLMNWSSPSAGNCPYTLRFGLAGSPRRTLR
jgi:hypothetical protein